MIKKISKYVNIQSIGLISFILTGIMLFEYNILKSFGMGLTFFILLLIVSYINNKPEIDTINEFKKDPEWKEYERLKEKFRGL